MQLKNKCQSI